MIPIGQHVALAGLPADLHDAIPFQAVAEVRSTGRVDLVLRLWLPVDGDQDQLELVLRGTGDPLPLDLLGADIHSAQVDEIESRLVVLFLYGDLYRRCLILCESIEARRLGGTEKAELPWNPETGKYEG